MKALLIKPRTKVSLKDYDPNDDSLIKGDKSDAIERLFTLRDQISDLQRIMYAERKHRLLIILQAMDTGGKDGTVRSVFTGIDPHGFRVVPFKAPTARELDFDFLWRIHPHVPAKGEIVVFNRSHYEDIIAVNVKRLAPPAVWEKRYEHVIAFEKMLSDEGATILKFYLHISRDEQRRRIQERMENPRKNWKFDPEDLNDRKRWPNFIAAYEQVLSRTSTPQAPWFVIPANKKYYRNVLVAQIVRDTLARLEPSWPEPRHDFSKLRWR